MTLHTHDSESWEQMVNEARRRWAPSGKKMVVNLPEPTLDREEQALFETIRANPELLDDTENETSDHQKLHLHEQYRRYPWPLAMLIDEVSISEARRGQAWFRLNAALEREGQKEDVVIPIYKRDWKRAKEGPESPEQTREPKVIEGTWNISVTDSPLV